jgi:hypothetical protein
MNDLDRAIIAMRRSQAALPDLCRELIKGELWVLVPYHPEVEGECIELKHGSPLPFAMLQDAKGAVVPLFSSEARLDEGLKKGKVPSNKYSAAAMPAIQALAILGKADLRAVVNKSCATGDITIPADLMRDLADGTALAPSPTREKEKGSGNIVNPADYPTHLIQPAFEVMRRHRNFRAAWIISLAQEKASEARWQLLILMEPPDEQILHDLNLAVASVRTRPDEIGLGLLDETDSSCIQAIFRKAAPFYVASDYVVPDGARPQIQ